MSVIDSNVSGGTRKGPGGRREVYVSGTGWVPAAEAPPDALKPKASPTSGDPVRRKPKVTDRQRQVWQAVQEHGTQAAAARALSTQQSTIQSALKGYMKGMGIEGDLPGRKQSDRFEVNGHQPEQHPPDYWQAKGESDRQVTLEPPPPAPAVIPVEAVRPPTQTRPAAPPSRVETVVAAAFAIGRASALLRLLAATDGSLNDAQRELASACAHDLEETL